MDEDKIAYPADDEDSSAKFHAHGGEKCPDCGRYLLDCECFEEGEEID